jgi:hypothetical protein
VQLRETWDLIYPGAKTFYGHGYSVDYDLDWLSAKAGWALENLTFQNFGFARGGLIVPHSSTQGAVVVLRCLDHLVVCVVGFHTALTYVAPLGLVRFRQPSKIGVECGIQCFCKGIAVNRHRFFCHTGS